MFPRTHLQPNETGRFRRPSGAELERQERLTEAERQAECEALRVAHERDPRVRRSAA